MYERAHASHIPGTEQGRGGAGRRPSPAGHAPTVRGDGPGEGQHARPTTKRNMCSIRGSVTGGEGKHNGLVREDHGDGRVPRALGRPDFAEGIAPSPRASGRRSRAKPVCCALTNGQCCDSPRRPTAAAHVLRAMPSRKLARPPGSRQHRPRHEPRPRHVRTPVLGRLAAPLRQRQARTPAPCQETGCTPFTAFSQSDLRICASRP